MSVLICYLSKTGNTRRVAEYLANGLSDQFPVHIKPLDQLLASELNQYDTVMVGTWIHRATAIMKAAKLIQSLQNKQVILFGTLAADPLSEHGLETIENLKKLLPEGNQLLDCFLLRGKADPKLAKQIKLIPPFVATKEQKQDMIHTMLSSRMATEEELALALKKCRSAIEKSLQSNSSGR